jgi:hypothetical protein
MQEIDGEFPAVHAVEFTTPIGEPRRGEQQEALL